MPTKSPDNRCIPTLQTSAIDYIRGFQQYHMNFWLCTLLLFLVELGCAILAAPSPMLLETAVCRYHFEKDRQLLNGEPTDEFCRSKEVQVHFAFVITVLSTLSTLAGMQNHISSSRRRLTVASDYDANPDGNTWGRRRHPSCSYAECYQYYLLLGMHSSHRYGVSHRTWRMRLTLTGSQQHFPLWGFYLSPIFILFGGGPWVTGTLVFAAINDSVKPEQRHALTLIIPNLITDMKGTEPRLSRSWRRYQGSRTSSGQLLAQ
jgi:hypothetical protein